MLKEKLIISGDSMNYITASLFAALDFKNPEAQVIAIPAKYECLEVGTRYQSFSRITK